MMTSLSTKRKSPETDLDALHNDNARTPTDSPPRKKLRITRKQKQALIDNLQLEITERARRLRAQYALQASDLRARIERRVNRIPVGLRKAKMGELLEKHNNAALRAQQGVAASKKPVSPSKSRNITTVSIDHAMHNSPATGTHARRARKPSHEGLYSDKENVPTARKPGDVLNNPKRRAKPGAAGGPSRVVSEEVRGPDYRILSPKSLNSRTYPHSPFRTSPEKPQHPSYLSHPPSPLKPSSPLKAGAATTRTATLTSSRTPSQAKRTASRTAATAAKTMRSPLARPATRQSERRGSTGTVSSTGSSGTAIVRPMRTVIGARKGTTASSSASAAASKKTSVTRTQAPSVAARRTTTTTTRKPTAPIAAETPATGRRILRKRV